MNVKYVLDKNNVFLFNVKMDVNLIYVNNHSIK
jgi:hypothetical protein